MDFSLRELECFLAVAEELSFTRAARRLHLAQPPLSRHVRTLEERLGAQLFIRGPRTVSLTVAGRSLYEETQHIPTLLNHAGEEARRCARGESARLRLGFVSAVMNDELIRVFRSFRQSHPSIEIVLRDLSPSEQLEAIADGRMDGGFVGLQPQKHPGGVKFVSWFREPLVCLVPSDHRLASRKLISVGDLRQEPFVTVSKEAAPDFSELLLEQCRVAGFRPRIVLESPRAQAVALMVATGSGVALLPASAANLAKDLSVTLRLREKVAINHVFAMRSAEPNPWISKFAGLLSGKRS